MMKIRRWPVSVKHNNDMTNKEYIEISLDGLNVSDGDIEIIMAKANIEPTDTCDTHACDVAIYNRMSIVIKSVMQNVTEGGYSISWNMDAVKIWYTALCNELGVENVLMSRPKVRNRSNMW